jgi:hypothetical protein
MLLRAPPGKIRARRTCLIASRADRSLPTEQAPGRPLQCRLNPWHPAERIRAAPGGSVFARADPRAKPVDRACGHLLEALGQRRGGRRRLQAPAGLGPGRGSRSDDGPRGPRPNRRVGRGRRSPPFGRSGQRPLRGRSQRTRPSAEGHLPPSQENGPSAATDTTLQPSRGRARACAEVSLRRPAESPPFEPSFAFPYPSPCRTGSAPVDS